MATVTDTLETIITLKGVNEMVAGLSQSTRLMQSAAVAEGLMATGAGTLAGALGALLTPLGLLGGALAAVTLFTVKAAQGWADEEQQLFRTSTALRNLSSNIPLGQVEAFAQQQERLTGTNRAVTEGLFAMAKNFLVADDQIQPLIRAALDFAAVSHKDVPEALEAILKASIGSGKGLKELGIHFQASGNRARDLARAMALVEERVGGAAGARLETLAGSLEHLSSSISDLLNDVGRTFGGGLARLINGIASAIDDLDDMFQRLFGTQEQFRRVGEAQPVTGNGRAGFVATTAEERQNQFLADIAANTGKTNEIIQRTIIGRGEIARRAFTIRDARVSFGI